jgi:hypothetical protein
VNPPTGCAPLPAATGNVISAGPGDDLQAVAADAATGDTIELEDGTYELGGSWLQFAKDGVTLRSKSGDATKVILDGGYQTQEAVRVIASNITIAEITIQRVVHHAIHVTAEQGIDTHGTKIYGVRVIDPGEQGIKINSASDHFTDDGSVACSSIVMTAAGRDHVSGCYTGGIDAHESYGWQVYDNYIEGFWCESGLSEHAIHFWTGSRDTIAERNVIKNCARGIGFGLQQDKPGRNYSDNPCPGITDAGHFNGIIRNNSIFADDPQLFASQFGFDTGIGLEQACGTVVAHNTVYSSTAPFAGIDIRFPKSTPIVANNLLSAGIKERDGAAPKAVEGNVENAQAGWFANAGSGDLHLASGASAAIDQAASVTGVSVSDDMDGDPRSGVFDIGADELE